MSGEPLRIVLADDHPLYRSGVRAVVERTAGMVWAGEATSGEEVLDLLDRVGADVVLMDLRMPGIGGLEATRRLLARPDPPAVLVLTMIDDDDAVSAALRTGARGYLLKGADEEEIVAAVRLVARGGAVIGAAVAGALRSRFDGADTPPSPFPELTAQERRVLQLLAAGRSTAGIATDLHLSTKTVRNHLSSTYAKLHVADRWEAIARAREQGWGR
jgi:DNA-binding NarL/FixJ family response regulator